MDLCNSPEILIAVQIIKKCLAILQVLIPVVLILVGIKGFYTYIVEDKDNLQEVVKQFITKLIIALSIIFIPTLISGFLKAVNISDNTFDSCITNATPEGIQKAYVNKEQDYIDTAKEKLTRASYRQAVIYLEHVEDSSTYKKMKAELDEILEYIKLAEKIDTLTLKNYSELYDELVEEIDKVTDKDVKKHLEEILEKKQKEIADFIGKYPVVPFGEYELYNNLTALKGKSLEQMLSENGSSIEELNKKIELAVTTAGKGTREASVAAVITLIGSVAEYGYKLPYRWGGKYNNIGANGNWGAVYTPNGSCTSYVAQGYAKTDAECQAKHKWSGLDCSGLVNWTVVQAKGVKTSQDDTNSGKKVTLNADKAVCQIGDALECKGHITIIVGLDDANKRYIIAEESNGMEIRSIPYSGKRGSTQYWCLDLSHNYTN